MLTEAPTVEPPRAREAKNFSTHRSTRKAKQVGFLQTFVLILTLLPLITLGGIATWLSKPKFTAERTGVTRGTYQVKVTQDKGTSVKDPYCLLKGWEGYHSSRINTTSKDTHVELSYTPSLVDDHPQHVIISWTFLGLRMKKTLPIL